MSDIEPYNYRRARREVEHYRRQATVASEQIAAVEDAAQQATLSFVRLRGIVAQAAALDPGGEAMYNTFAVSAGMTMNQAIQSAGRRPL